MIADVQYEQAPGCQANIGPVCLKCGKCGRRFNGEGAITHDPTGMYSPMLPDNTEVAELEAERDALKARLAEVEAQAAKMREALEYIYKAADWDRLRSSDAYYTGLFLTPAQEHRVHCIVAEALSAGRALLEQ